MPASSGAFRADELAAVGLATADPFLRALELAIHIEEATGVVLPDSVLNHAHLASPQDCVRTVAAILEDH